MFETSVRYKSKSFPFSTGGDQLNSDDLSINHEDTCLEEHPEQKEPVTFSGLLQALWMWSQKSHHQLQMNCNCDLSSMLEVSWDVWSSSIEESGSRFSRVNGAFKAWLEAVGVLGSAPSVCVASGDAWQFSEERLAIQVGFYFKFCLHLLPEDAMALQMCSSLFPLRYIESQSKSPHAHRQITVLKWFFKRLCGSTKNHHLLKNHFGNGALKIFLLMFFETPL